MKSNLFENLAKELVITMQKEYAGSKFAKLDEENKTILILFKRVLKNITTLFEKLNLANIEFESFEGLFNNKKVNSVETDLSQLERYYNNKVFKELLTSIYPLVRLYYIIRLYDQKLLLSKFYIKNGLQKQSDFDELKLEAEELRNKTEFDLVLNFVKQNKHKKVWRKLIPHYADIAQRFNCYHRTSKKINFSEVARQIRNIVGVSKVPYTTVLQALDRYKK